MKSAKTLIKLANQCQINSNPPNPPEFDLEKFSTLVTIKEKAEFLRLLLLGTTVTNCIELINQMQREELLVLKEIFDNNPDSSECIGSYRGKFYRTTYNHEGDTVTAVMYDDKNNVHTIWSNGKVVSTKEL
jgi:uncharacterized protein (DUF1810 family)